MKLRDMSSDDQRAVMVAMWHRLGALFGSAWESQYGTVQNQTIHAWAGALAEFGAAEIREAVRLCESWEDKFPPTFPQFKALCLSARNRGRNFTERRMELEKRHGKPAGLIEHLQRVATSDVAKREIERMKRIVAGEEVETREESYTNLGLPKRWGHLTDADF